MKRDPPMWIAAGFEFMNTPVESNSNIFTDNLLVKKPVVLGYNKVKNPDYVNLNLKNDGFINYFGEDCVEWFLNEMLEIEVFIKKNFKSEIKTNLVTIPQN